MDRGDELLNLTETTVNHLDKFVQNVNEKTKSKDEILKMRTVECEKIEECNEKVLNLIKMLSNDWILDVKSEEEVEKLTEEVNQLKISTEELTEEHDRINKKIISDSENLESKLKAENSRLKADSELLSYIFNCEVQPDDDPNVLKGVVKGVNDEAKPFSVDTGDHSHFFVTNYLWDLISE